MKPTNTQKIALRMAARAPVRYYKGGWYSIPAYLGDSQTAPHVGGVSVGRQTLDACVARGWLKTAGGVAIYGQRWCIAEEGHEALKGQLP